jgi:hypothetical protein
LLEDSLGLSSVLEWNDSINDGTQLSTLHELQQMTKLCLRSHGRTEDREALEEHGATGDAGRGLAGGATQDDPTGPGQRRETPLEDLAADVVEDDFDALALGDLADARGEVFAVIVDGVGRAELASHLELVVSAGGDDDVASSDQRCDLDAGTGDSGAGSVNQDIFERLELGPVDQHVPGCQKDEGQRGSLNVVEACGKRQDVSLGNTDPLRVTTVSMLSEDAVLPTLVVRTGDTSVTGAA